MCVDSMMSALITRLTNKTGCSIPQLCKQLTCDEETVKTLLSTLVAWEAAIDELPDGRYRLSSKIPLYEVTQLQSALPKNTLHYKPVCCSTNQFFLDNLTQCQSGDICITEYQTGGRGRRGKVWHAVFGKNICYSQYWLTHQTVSALTGLSLVVGIVIANVLRELGETEVKIKWPNDIYLNNKKLAGILIELAKSGKQMTNVVIGIGINLESSNNVYGIGAPISADLSHRVLDKNALVIALTKALNRALALFEQEGLAAFISQWNALDNFINTPVKLLLGEQEILGIARGIDKNGAILLEQSGEVTSYIGNEISLRPL